MILQAILHCPKCNIDPFKLYGKQVKEGSDVYQNVLEPKPDGPIQCPQCKGGLVRVNP